MYPIELDDSADAPFPPVERALREPDGLLAWGGDLSPLRLLNASPRNSAASTRMKIDAVSLRIDATEASVYL